jgi:hypothetical protein
LLRQFAANLARQPERNQARGVARQARLLQAGIGSGAIGERTAAVQLRQQPALIAAQPKAWLGEFLAPAPRRLEHDRLGRKLLAFACGRVSAGRRRSAHRLWLLGEDIGHASMLTATVPPLRRRAPNPKGCGNACLRSSALRRRASSVHPCGA